MPPDRQAVQRRRAFLIVGALIAVVVIALLVHGCQVSQANSALKNYNNNVYSVLQDSDATSTQLFNQLKSASSQTNLAELQTQINATRMRAEQELQKAKGLSVPSQLKQAQQNLVLALQMRADAIGNIGTQIQPALGKSASQDAINSIAASMATLYASDVVYKGYVAPMIASSLNAAKVSGQPIFSGQFLPNVQWVQPSFVATSLNTSLPATSTSGGRLAPGTHGHQMVSVSAGGTTLQQGGTNTVAASPPPTFTCTFQNSGQNAETNVVVRVTVGGIVGQKLVPKTQPGQRYSEAITLPSSPPKGTQTVTATVQPVPGEHDTANNTLTYQVDFQ
jgi:hypothetical protein